MEKAKKNIGIPVTAPKGDCSDKHCAFHGQLPVRGRVFTGKVIKADYSRTINVEWTRMHYLKKYERYEKRRSRVKAHNPLCINAKVGDIVQIAECRPISKTKSFVAIQREESKQ
ncbi:30S ribosomal protein S17 [Candidatus Woesearchaeota archaeon]|nr:30S ribosomal protein S17 [Candidatus Woesearchaeota archaeon]